MTKLQWTPMMRISFGVLATNCVGYFWLMFQMIYPVQIFEFITPVKPLGEWRAGSSVQYQMDVMKYIQLPAISNTYLRNDRVTWNVDSHPSNYPVGRRTSVSAADLDPDIPPGPYVFGWSGTWKVNFLRDKTVTSESKEMVEILPAVKAK